MVDQQARPHSDNGDGRQRPGYGAIPQPSDRTQAAGGSRPESREHPYSHESIPHQIRGLSQDVTTLFSKEMALARAEVREAAAGVKAGISSISAGVGLTTAGLIITLMAAVYGLATIWPLWLSALVVGPIALIVGGILLSAGSKKIEPKAFKPERTIDEMHHDKEAARRVH